MLYLTGMQMRDLYGASYRVKEEITISDLLARLQRVVGRETEVIRSQLFRNHIELIPGLASFIDPHTLSVDIEGQQVHRTLTAHKLVIATGTVPARPNCSSTVSRSSTPTRSWSWRRSPTPWSWWGPG